LTLGDIPVTYRHLAEWLTSGGYPCGINDLKNANRKEARLEPNVVPRTPSTELFVEYVRKVFPDFDETTFFVPEVTAIPA